MPPAPDGMRRCRQCLQNKPQDSFSRNVFGGLERGTFCGPCRRVVAIARKQMMTAAEIADVVLVQEDYDLHRPEAEVEEFKCKFCLRTRPAYCYVRDVNAVRMAVELVVVCCICHHAAALSQRLSMCTNHLSVRHAS